MSPRPAARAVRADSQVRLSTLAAAVTTVAAFAWMLSVGSAQNSGLYVDRSLRPHAAAMATVRPPARAVIPEGGQLMDLVRQATWPTRLRAVPAGAGDAMESKNG